MSHAFFQKSDLEYVRSIVRCYAGPDVPVEFEEAARSTFNRKVVYCLYVGNVSIFAELSSDRFFAMQTFRVECERPKIPEERYGVLENAVKRAVEILKEQSNAE